jgi:hypothetical protein
VQIVRWGSFPHIKFADEHVFNGVRGQQGLVAIFGTR